MRQIPADARCRSAGAIASLPPCAPRRWEAEHTSAIRAAAVPSRAMHPRVVLHADMDAFYASIEQRDHPELRGRPVAVGGDGRRGVVSAASYEARALRRALGDVLASRRAGAAPSSCSCADRCGAMRRESKRIFEIFQRFTPAVQGLSLDEAFLDLTGTERLLGPGARRGRARCAARCATRRSSRCRSGSRP